MKRFLNIVILLGCTAAGVVSWKLMGDEYWYTIPICIGIGAMILFGKAIFKNKSD